MKIGLIVATADEVAALIAALNKPRWACEVQGYIVRNFCVADNEIYTVESGAGEIRAAAATQMLISNFDVKLIANFGVCGGLTESAVIAAAFTVQAVVHYDYDTSAVDGCEPGKYEQYESVYIPVSAEAVNSAVEAVPGLHRAICASGDKFVADPEVKRQLFKKYGAEICDMEAAGILLTANRAGIPALLIKTVSDSVTGGADEYLRTVSLAAQNCVDCLLTALNK